MTTLESGKKGKRNYGEIGKRVERIESRKEKEKS